MRRLCVLLLLMFMLSSHSLQAQTRGRIAITMDDPQTKEMPLMSAAQYDEAIRSALDKHHCQAALFVCAKRVSDGRGKQLLARWDEAGHLICNHSVNHPSFASKLISAQECCLEIAKCDSLIQQYKHYTKLFRFPFLKEGNTVERRDSIRTWMHEHGYRNGVVTIDASDWYVDQELRKALVDDMKTDTRVYAEYYFQHILDRISYYDSLAHAAGIKIKVHTLLIHHSLLNGLFLDELLSRIEAQGWSLANASDAFAQDILTTEPDVIPAGEGLVWSMASLNPEIKKTLRYPAEDGEYEQQGLEDFVAAKKK